MCYSIFLSTDSELDLSTENSELIQFARESVPEPYLPLMKYSNHWFVGSKSGCSCTFRHLYSVELGFSEPVAWYEEEQAEIVATLVFIRLVRRIIENGDKADCIDLWEGTPVEAVQEILVDLDEITDEQFRFFENHHFSFQSSMQLP